MDSVRPQSPDEVRETLLRAARQGGRVSVHRPLEPGGLRLDLSGLAAIREIDPANLLAVAEPGVSLGALHQALAAHGLRFVPAASFLLSGMSLGDFCGLGAPNPFSIKYGPAKHLLLGSTVVLGSGETVKTGGRTVKNVTGYDLTRFLNAPLAGLGVTVEYILKLLPAAEARFEGAASFVDVHEAVVFAQSLRGQGLAPAQVLWVDPVARAVAGDGPDDGGHLVLFELDGAAEEVERQTEALFALLDASGGRSLDADRLAAARRDLGDLFAVSKGLAVYGEYSLAAGRLLDAVDSVRAWARDANVQVGLFGQVAEGKLALRLRGDAPAQADTVQAVSEHVKKRGGFVSGRFDRLLGRTPQGGLGRMETIMRTRFDPCGVLAG